MMKSENIMTIKEIAQLAGVSISTVSKIVNKKDDNINPETRNRVLEIVKQYNYTPYGTVKTISAPKRFVIGVLLKSSIGASSILSGISKAAREKGYGVLLYQCGDCPEEELKHITALCTQKVDGVLWEPFSQDSLPQYLHHFQAADIPVVNLNAPFASKEFSIDYRKIGYLSANQLFHSGHQKICCIGKTEDPRLPLLYDGICSCLFENRLSFDQAFLLEESSDYLPTLTSGTVTGIICCDLALSLTLYMELNRLNLLIPNDLSLLSLIPEEETTPIPFLSGITVPFFSLGYLACLWLIQTAEKSEAPVLPFTLESRYILNHKRSLTPPLHLKTGKFIVIGSINTDVNLSVNDFPESGKSTLITDSASNAGGKGTNQSVGISRMGHEAILIGRVGKDADSLLVLNTLNENHLSSGCIYQDETAQTGKAYIYILKDGEITITYIPGANLQLMPADIRRQKKWFEQCEYCLISTDIPLEAAVEAARLAKAHQTKVILKPSTLDLLPEIFYETTELFIPNQQEAAALCPSLDSVEKQADFFFRKGMPIVIITLGADGCYVKTADFHGHFPVPEFPLVDATGGADAFISSLVSHLSDGYDLNKAIQISQYAAGFCISHQGVTDVLMTKEELHKYIQKKEPYLLQK